MDAVRTCLGCRQRAPRTSLVRIVARDGRVVVDAAARLPGRGAWVHPDPGCVDTAIRRRAFGRALRVATALDTTELTNIYPRP
ncbi:YlxR family protein [Protaetiibacter larvae]|uniref:YlxR family protein n=1 Tax=Protaetiibacter larvae TaxID=2592654 RepID=A0A5C1YAT5_9MICO|nr:YlxR family protein [Protaetiibacter larvae]QEO10329.1 YlxR family protein [Protaetiibacter larvae]